MFGKPIKILMAAFGLSIILSTMNSFADDKSADIQQKPRIVVEYAEAVEPEPEPIMSEEDIDLLALVTMAEAEGEPEEGQRLVIDTVLNRVDSEHFPDTVHGVVYQKNHFSSMWDGRVEQCYVMDDIRNLVLEELESRTNSEVVYFRTGKYSKYGSPMFKVGAHYFSSND